MKKQQEMLKSMNEEERQGWATQRFGSHLIRLKRDGFTTEELAQAALTVGGAYLGHALGKEKAAAYLMMLARKLIDPVETLPGVPESDLPDVVH